MIPAEGFRGSQKWRSRQRASGVPRSGDPGRGIPEEGVPRSGDPGRGLQGFPEVVIPAEGFMGSQKWRSRQRDSGVPRSGDPGRGIQGFPEVEIPAEGFRGFKKMRSRQKDLGVPTRGDSKQRGSQKADFQQRGSGDPS